MNLELAEMSEEEIARQKESEEQVSESTTLKQIEDAVTKPLPSPSKEVVKKSKESESLQSPQKAEIKSTQRVKEVIIEIPEWTKKPFMYVLPGHEQLRQSWFEHWGKFLVYYCTQKMIHIISLPTISQEHPFSNNEINRSLTIKQLQELVENLVEKGLARWKSEDKLVARIMYRTDEEFANQIFSFLEEKGLLIEIIVLKSLQNHAQEWSTLPEDELEKIIDVMVQQGRAKWIGSDKSTFEFVL